MNERSLAVRGNELFGTGLAKYFIEVIRKQFHLPDTDSNSDGLDAFCQDFGCAFDIAAFMSCGDKAGFVG